LATFTEEDRRMAEKELLKQSCEDLPQRVRDEVLPLFDKAVDDDSSLFENPYLKNCWEEKGCQKDSCPIFKEPKPRCWQVTGTYCGGKAQGAFVDKYANCKECEVYRNACPTIVEELGEHLNNMVFLLRKKNESAKRQLQNIDHLNRELRSALENLDSRNMEIQTLVITDKLTGLYNRHYLMTVLDDEIIRHARKGYQFTVLMLDIDDFKSLNDTYGHLFGDEVLTSLGGMLKRTTRNYDRSFRSGGEEFIVVMPETEQTVAWMVAERIREALAEVQFDAETDNGEEKVSRTLSIGVATYTADLDIPGLLKQADDALYEAKSRGKNQVVRYSEI
jgi:diguanylate cyclase (GGDEF)-like protein